MDKQEFEKKINSIPQQELNSWGDSIPFYSITLIWIAVTIYGIWATLFFIKSMTPSLDPSIVKNVQDLVPYIGFVILNMSLTFLVVFLSGLKYLFKRNYHYTAAERQKQAEWEHKA